MKVPAGFSRFEQRTAEAKFCGLVRDGFAGAVEYCLRLDSSAAKICKDRPKIRAAVVDNCFIKRYNLPGWWNQLRRPLRSGRPLQVLLATERLEKAGIPVMPVFAVLSEKSSAGIRDYLITGCMAQDQQTIDLILRSPASAQANWQIMLNKVLPQIVSWHQAGVEHGDLNMRNICSDREFSTVCPIDLDGAVLYKGMLPVAAATRELARLASGFLLLNQDADPAELAADVCGKYRTLAGVDCDCRRVLKRMKYLLREKWAKSV